VAARTQAGGAARTGTPPGDRGGVPERLVAEATRLFAEKGFDRVAVQEIVDAAGVTKGAMYHYFGSKDDLLHEIYGRVLRMQTERLEAVAASAAPLPERLRAAAVDVIVTSIANFDETKVFYRSMDHLSPAKHREVRAERRRYHERFRALVAEGQQAGTFRADVPADLVVNYFFGSVHHLGTWYSADGPLSARQVGEHFAELLLSSLRPE
jgi:AcrR family transcriptional regulator